MIKILDQNPHLAIKSYKYLLEQTELSNLNFQNVNFLVKLFRQSSNLGINQVSDKYQRKCIRQNSILI